MVGMCPEVKNNDFLNYCVQISVLVSLVLSLMTCVSSGFSGYSYAKFRGPVSGPEREVSVDHDDGKYHYHHHHHKPAHDYVAKPDYHFAYGVDDPKSMVKQSRHETRYGDAVKGEYRLEVSYTNTHSSDQI